MNTANHLTTFVRSLKQRVGERMDIIFRRKRGGLSNYLIAFALVGFALLVRLWIAPLEAGIQYITFFPAVALAAVFCGFGPGVFAIFIGMCLATFIFVPPFYSVSLHSLQAALWSNMVFSLDGIVVCSSVEAMHRYRAKLSDQLNETRKQSEYTATINRGLLVEIAGRKLSQQAAETLLKRNQALMLTSMDGIHVMDMQGNVVVANDAFCRMLGYTQEEVCGLNVADWDAQGEEIRARFMDIINHSIRIETVHRRKDGTLIDVDISISGVELEGQGFIFASSRDITERKRAEGVLKLNRTIIETAYDGFWLFDRDGYLFDVNQAYADMVGYTREELIGKHISQISLRSNAPELVRARIEKAIAEGPGHFETQHRHKDGHIVDFDASIAFILEAGCLFSFLRDITERKKAEAALKRHKAVIDTAIDGFWMVDASGNLLEANEAYARISGYSTGELVGMHISQLEAIERSPEEVQAHIARVVAHGYDRFETRHRHKDGHEIDIEVSVAYMAEAQQLCVFCRNISERKKLEQALVSSEALFRELFENMSSAVAIYEAVDDGEDFLFRNFNRSGESAENIRREQLIGKRLAEVFPGVKEFGLFGVLQRVWRTGQPEHFPAAFYHDQRIAGWRENYVYRLPSREVVAIYDDVTELKKAEEELRVAAAAFETQDAIAITDANGYILRANRAFQSITGYSPDEVLGKKFSAMSPVQPGDDPCVEMLRQSIGGGTWSGEIFGRHKNGRIYPQWLTITAVKNERLETIRHVVIFSDITERKQAAEAKLREIDLRFRGTMEQVGVGIIHVSLDGQFKQINRKFCEIVGYSRDELIHKDFQDIIFPDDLDESIHYIRELLAGEIPVFSMEKRYVRKDRSLVWVSLTVSLLRDAGGTPTYTIGVIEDITGRKHAEVVVQQFGSLLQGSFNEIYMFDAESLHFLLASEGAEKNLGYSSEELSRLTPLDIKPLFTPESFEQLVVPLRSGEQQSLFFVTIHRRKDGTTYPAEVRMQLMTTATTATFLAIVQDITERKQAENDLLRQKSFFRQVIDADPSLIFVKDAGGRLLFANQAIASLYGLTPDEMLGEKYLARLKRHGGEAELYQEMDREVIGELRTVSFIHPSSLGGKKRWFLTIKTPMVLPDGTVNVLGISVDITERKQAEELLRKSSEEVEDLYNRAPCGYHSLDKDGVILMVNDTELAWLGYTRDELIGKMKWPDLLAPAGVQVFRETYPQLKKRGFVRDIEVEIIRKDGTTFNGLINATAIYDSNGNYMMSRSTVADITGRKRVERQLRDLSAHLQTVREEEKNSIAREIHDDLGGTLTALKMETHHLETGLSQDENTVPFLGHVASMSQLINTAAGITRRIISDLRPTILDDLGLLAAIEWQTAQFHKRTGIEYLVNCIGDKGNLDKLHSIALFRILQEALTNVMRHSGASRVEIEFHHSDEEVVLSISDNGHGLPEDLGVKPGSYGMLGMIERVEQLGGTIRFDVPPGGGLGVTVIFPLPAGDGSI